MASSSPTPFLTEAPNAQTIADPVSMARVRDEYSKLQDVVDQLGAKVSGVLAKQGA